MMPCWVLTEDAVLHTNFVGPFTGHSSVLRAQPLLCNNKPTHLMTQLPHTQASGRPDDNHLGPLRLPSLASWLSTCRCMVTLSSCVSASLTWNSTVSASASSLNCLKSCRAFLQMCCCLLSAVWHTSQHTLDVIQRPWFQAGRISLPRHQPSRWMKGNGEGQAGR